jgi:DNA modification methylase
MSERTEARHLLMRGDARRIPLKDQSVQMVCTSPPYFGLRDYQTASWVGGDPGCDHLGPPRGGIGRETISGGKTNQHATRQATYRDVCGRCGARRVDSQIGLEPTPDEFVAAMVEVFREVWRVLRIDGCVWLNLGDSYAGGGGGNYGDGKSVRSQGGQQVTNVRNRSVWLDHAGLKPKDLMGVPHAVAFALRDDGWYLRSAAPWVKRSSMPESCLDRPSSSLEYVFMLTKAPRYYYDADAVRLNGAGRLDRGRGNKGRIGPQGWRAEPLTDPAGRNRRNGDWWYESLDGVVGDTAAGMVTSGMVDAVPAGEDILGFDVSPEAFSGSHFAVMPQKLVEPMIRAGTSEAGACPKCGKAWVRIVDAPHRGATQTRNGRGDPGMSCPSGMAIGSDTRGMPSYQGKTTGWAPSCSCSPVLPPVPQLVFDPFAGSGTTLLTARRLGRSAVGCDLSADYLALAARRIADGLRPRSRLDAKPFVHASGQLDLF